MHDVLLADCEPKHCRIKPEQRNGGVSRLSVLQLNSKTPDASQPKDSNPLCPEDGATTTYTKREREVQTAA